MFPWLEAGVAGLICVSAFDSYLDWRQYSKVRKSALEKRPAELEGLVTEKAYHEGLAYHKDKLAFGLLSSAFDSFLSVFCLSFYFWPFLYRQTASLLPARFQTSQIATVCYPGRVCMYIMFMSV